MNANPSEKIHAPRLHMWRASVLLMASALIACEREPDPTPRLSLAELMDPETCKDCHERHYREWKSSMHAYAADDPVFIAMNKRGQEETDGELGDFCVQCHAPMAVALGETQDGLNLDALPQHLKGITCYYCHSVEGVEGPPHNNPLVVRTDNETMYGPFADPAPSTPHASAYSPFLDQKRPQASEMCGTCHDIMTPNGVHLERTYHEWQASIFGPDGPAFLGCSNCHMHTRTDTAVSGPRAPSDVFQRTVHEHLWPGVDTAISPTPFPADEPELMEAQRLAIMREFQDTAQIIQIELAPGEPGSVLYLTVEAIGTGHHWPSGATQDRRAWIEVTAYRDGEVIFQSGHVGEDDGVVDVARRDPQMKVLRDLVFDAEGQEAHMFWDAAKSEQYPNGYVPQRVLPGPTSLPPNDHTELYRYEITAGVPDRVEAVFKIRAMGRDVLEDLYKSGHLSPEDHTPIPTFALEGTRIDWRPSSSSGFGSERFPTSVGTKIDFCEYRRFFGDCE